MSPDHFRKLERMYASAPINEFFRPDLRVERGRAELTMAVRPEFFHAAHAMHGSVYFKALDDAAFFAVSSLVEDVFVLTATFQVYLLRPVSAGRVLARGQVVHEAGRSWIAESVLVDEEGRQLARGTGSFARSRIRLSEDVGYRP